MDDKIAEYNNEMINMQTTSRLSYLLSTYRELVNSIDEIKSEYHKSLDNQYYTLMSEINFTRGIVWLMIGVIIFSGVSGFIGIGFGIFDVLLVIGYFVESYECRKKVK